MPTYQYKATDAGGGLHSGEIGLGSRSAVLDALASRGLIPIEVRESGGRTAASAWLGVSQRLRPRRDRHRLTLREVLSLTDSLAALCGAGLTVDRTLQISASLAPSAPVKRVSESLLNAVRAGKTLSISMAESLRGAPPYYVSMIEAGEIGGSLPVSLTRLSELMRRQLQVRERMRSALFYPCILAGVVMFTLVILLAFVLPRFEAMFAESEAPLPWSTGAVLALGQFVADYWWGLLIGVAAVTAAAIAWLRSPGGAERFDRWMIRSRLTFGVPVAANTARLLRTLSTLCRNGLPLPSALKVARGTMANRCLVNAVEEVTRSVQAGGFLSAALARAAVFPMIAVQLARVGEETGRLDELLYSAAMILEEESQVRLERLLTLVVPMATILMGLIVAALIGSVLIGLLSINDVAI